MKTLVIFLACFVGLSYQQRYIWPMPFAPRAHLMPLFYADGTPADFEQLPEVKQLDNVDQKVFSLGGGGGGGLNFFTTTKTVLSTVVSTVSTPTTVQCIAKFVFNNTNATTACNRRRRDIEELKAIVPAQPLPLEVTAVETMPQIEAKEVIAPEIESSQMTVSDDGPIANEERLFSLSLVSTVSVTQYTTVVSFAPYTVKSTAAIAANGSLNCLPSGYVVC